MRESEAVTLRDEAVVTVRPIRPNDAPRLQALFARLSPESIFLRFLGLRKELSRKQAEYLAHLDYRTRMAPVSASPIAIEDYSGNLWGRDIRTLYNLKRSDAEEFFGIVDQLDLMVGTGVFQFEELQEALILAKQGKLLQPNAVIEITGSSRGRVRCGVQLKMGIK